MGKSNSYCYFSFINGVNHIRHAEISMESKMGVVKHFSRMEAYSIKHTTLNFCIHTSLTGNLELMKRIQLNLFS